MSKLGEAQEAHAVRISWLILIASEDHGIKVRKCDAFRDPRLHGEFGEKKAYGAAFSCHKLKLADDLYTAKDSDHVIMHDIWDSLGGAERILDDMNHYSSGWEKYI